MTEVKKGDLFVLTRGEYDLYRILGSYVATQDFDYNEQLNLFYKKSLKNALNENNKPSYMLDHLKESGLVKFKKVSELYLEDPGDITSYETEDSYHNVSY